MKKLLLTGIAALFLATGTAHATLDGCAVVLRTPDGFLNLRAAPTMKARVVTRLKPGEILYDTSAGYVKGWAHITDVNRPKNVSGWVGRRFIIPSDCEMLDPPATADK